MTFQDKFEEFRKKRSSGKRDNLSEIEEALHEKSVQKSKISPKDEPSKKESSKKEASKKDSSKKDSKDPIKDKDLKDAQDKRTQSLTSIEKALDDIIDFEIMPPAVVVILSILTGGLFYVVWLFKIQKRLKEHMPLAIDPKIIFLFLIPFVNIIAYFYLIHDMSVRLGAYLKKEPMTLFIIWVLFFPAAIVIVQNGINNKGSDKNIVSKSKVRSASAAKAKKKSHKIHKSKSEQMRFFSQFLQHAGISKEPSLLMKYILIASVAPTLMIVFYLVIKAVIEKTFIMDAITLIGSVIVLLPILLFFVLWLLLFIYADMSIFRRRKEIEQVFPDYLHLTAANINAGMPIDRALWFAIRPRFGILAKEMEEVAKSTMVGEKLDEALINFSKKYDSVVVSRALNLLLEGLSSGGEVGDILTRVANNIRDTDILKKEMAANVTTYVIFILFATLGAAPFLFGLTTQLVIIMKSIIGNINIDGGSGGAGLGAGLFSSGTETIATSDYRIFAITTIAITCIMSGILVGVIQKGNVKESLKNIPLYILVGVINYLIASWLLGYMLGGFFS